MNIQAKFIKADGAIQNIRPGNGKHFSLEELQAFVGGYIEIIRPPSQSGALLVCNEEGKLEGLPLNPLATRMWQEQAEPGSPRMDDDIVGNVVLCHSSQIE